MIMAEGKVALIIAKLGIVVDRERGDEMIALCPGHELRTGKPDNSPSWSINTETGLHHCFSCGYKGGILSLVAEQKEFFTDWNRLDIDKAKSWLSSNTDVDLEALVKNLDLIKESYISIPKPVQMSEARLALFTHQIPTWALESRKLTIEAAEAYGVMWDERTSSWILPIYEHNSVRLFGWQEKGTVNKHFMNRPTGVMKSKTVFRELDSLPGDTVIVVESPLDAVRLRSAGIHGGVAIFGASISDDQVNILRGYENIVFAFDNPNFDKAGFNAAIQMIARSRKEGIECRFFNYGTSEAKDIGEMSDAEILYGLENAKHCVLGKAAVR